MDTRHFLSTVVTSSQPGWFCLAVSNGSGGWLEQWHNWPADIDKIVERADEQSKHANVYFSSYLFRAPQSTKANVLPTRTLQADLDNADIRTLPREPTVLVETSPGRHQGYWVLDQELDPDAHETLSKKLTYSIPLCDRSGWPLGRKVRLPNTFNYKYLSGPKRVSVLRASGTTYGAEEFEALPDVPQFLTEHFDDGFVESPTGTPGIEGIELLDAIKDIIPVNVYVNYGAVQSDRSEALWALMCWGFKAGLNRQQVFTLAKGSANNKFADQKHRGDQDLAKDILRAEHTVRSNIQDDKQVILELFKSATSPIERKRAIFQVVLKSMQAQGEFLYALQGHAWYIRRDMGKPITISLMSEHLQSLLDIQFGLNPTEAESKYTIASIRSFAYTLPQDAIQGALSYYNAGDQASGPYMLIHTGKKTVMHITRDEITSATDGAYGVVFPWIPSADTFTPALGAGATVDWGSEVFGNGSRGFGSSVDNVTNMTPAQAMAVLKVWLMFVLFREAAAARPILATLGQPGSGKSCLMRKVYRVLYGRHKAVSGITTVEDFDHGTAYDPLHVIDNVDTWERWLPDRLAISAGVSDITKRKLYTDVDTLTLRRQAVLGITAHNPKFGREDVADRFLLLSFSRLTNFASEDEIYRDLTAKRNLIWGGIIHDIQRVLRTPMPTPNEIPQFRIEDFARIGLWIARGIGVEADFRSAIEDVKSSQQMFTLEEEGLLVAAILKLVARQHQNGGPKYYTSSQLWTLLEATADDARAFATQYRNSVNLSKKLSSMQQSLGRMVEIRQRPGQSGSKTWLIQEKGSQA